MDRESSLIAELSELAAKKVKQTALLDNKKAELAKCRGEAARLREEYYELLAKANHAMSNFKQAKTALTIESQQTEASIAGWNQRRQDILQLMLDPNGTDPLPSPKSILQDTTISPKPEISQQHMIDAAKAAVPISKTDKLPSFPKAIIAPATPTLLTTAEPDIDTAVAELATGDAPNTPVTSQESSTQSTVAKVTTEEVQLPSCIIQYSTPGFVDPKEGWVEPTHGWIELRCPRCGRNARYSGRFFKGLDGFRRHFYSVHNDEDPAHADHEFFMHREVSLDEIKAIRTKRADAPIIDCIYHETIPTERDDFVDEDESLGEASCSEDEIGSEEESVSEEEDESGSEEASDSKEKSSSEAESSAEDVTKLTELDNTFSTDYEHSWTFRKRRRLDYSTAGVPLGEMPWI